MVSVFTGKYREETLFPSGLWVDEGCSVKYKTSCFSHDAGYAAYCAPDNDARFWSASTTFICAFSDNVPEILRTLYNCVSTANNKVRGLRESPPLHVLWLSLTAGAWWSGSTTPSGRPHHGCLLPAAAAPALYSLRAVADRQYYLCWQSLRRSVKSSVGLQCSYVLFQYHSADVAWVGSAGAVWPAYLSAGLCALVGL